MATRAATFTNNGLGHLVATWTNLDQATSDVGEAVTFGWADNIVIQIVSGTTPSIQMQGSNDGIQWGDLINVVGTALADITDLTTLQLSAPVRFIRPMATGTAVDCVVVAVGVQRRT